MSKIKYPSNSPYSSTPQTSSYLGRFVWRNIPPDTADRLFTLTPKHQYRPDILSYELYNTGAYWWIFSVRNPYLRSDPLWSFVTGAVLWVPSADYVRRVIG